MKQVLNRYEDFPSILLLIILSIAQMGNHLLMLCLSLTILNVFSQQLTVAIIGSNDIHGKAFPTTLARADTGEKYEYGGLVYMASLIDIINQQNPGNTLYLDAGDQFQGGIESSKLISSGQIMNDFYNTIGVKASSIGNHEFDFGPQFLMPYLAGKNSKNIAGNIRSEKGEMNFLPNQKSSIIYEFANGIKVGVIGLTTLETPASTGAFSSGKFPPYQFLEYKKIVMDESFKLRSAGVNAVLVLSHSGDACASDFTYRNRTKQTSEDPCPYDEISYLIDVLPEGTIDGVVQGHRHRMVHHYYKGIPYIGTINGGYYLNILYLKFNANKQLMDTLIQGPVPVCDRVFKNIGRCNYLNAQEVQSAGQLTNWQFHNRNVIKHDKLQAIFEQRWVLLMEPYFREIVNNEIELRKQDTKESELANLYTNLIHQAIPEADFVIVNSGGFRTEWLPGVLQYQHFYGMFPFQNVLQTFEITGSELLEMLRVIQSGEKGFYHSWGLQMRVTYQNLKRGFISAKFSSGDQIDPVRTYIGAADDFLLTGGDDFKDVINKVYTPRNLISKGQYKSVVQQHLIDMKVIRANTLIDPENPRLIVNQ